MKFDTKMIKASADIETVVDALGIDGERKGRYLAILCPNPDHHDRHIGSCMINLEKQECRCYSCGARYDVISLAQTVNGSSFPEACRFVMDACGLSGFPYELEGETREAPKNRIPKEVAKLLELDPATEKSDPKVREAIRHQIRKRKKMISVIGNGMCKEISEYHLDPETLLRIYQQQLREYEELYEEYRIIKK